MRAGLRRWSPSPGSVGIFSAALLGAAVTFQPDDSGEPHERHPAGNALRLLNQMAEPGDLTIAHAPFDNEDACVECHTLGQGVPDEACLACHTLIGERKQSGMGWHASVKGECITCHTDHRGRGFDIMEFNHRDFNHEQTTWRLVGAHRDLECRTCHVDLVEDSQTIGWQFLGIGQDCLGCHVDPHGETLGNDCVTCHTQETWQDTHLFDHETMTAFPLEELHAGLDCAECHAPIEDEAVHTFSVGGSDCVTCHTAIQAVLSGEMFAGTLGDAPPDVHIGETDCLSCHSTTDRSTRLGTIAPRCVECHTPAHGQQLYETARLIDLTLQRFERDEHGTLATGPCAGLTAGDLIHNPVAWMEVVTGEQVR